VKAHTLAVAALSSLTVLASAQAGSSSPASSPLLVAVEGPQSGEQATNGLDQLRGVRLAVSQLNARGGLWDGRGVAVFPVDDKADAAHAKQVARQVVAKGIGFVIGSFNSSVGIANLGFYRRNHVLPLWMTSRDETAGAGATVQPMNSQIAPVEEAYLNRLPARRVAMLVDDTANGAFTKGMASRLRKALLHDGVAVTWISVRETTTARLPSAYYPARVAKALATRPDLVYVSTYFPEGVAIAKALTAAGTAPPCLMGLANVDNGFLAKTTLAEASRCVFSGVPAATEMPSARTYVRRYRTKFGRVPGVWGSFTYDSANILFAAINRARSDAFGSVEHDLRTTTRYRGSTGTITIDPKTGYRTTVPVSILRIDRRKTFVIASR
jgi:branched-chain amino acid transport system substrate-binding protein